MSSSVYANVGIKFNIETVSLKSNSLQTVIIYDA